MNKTEFSELSVQLTKKLTKKEKQQDGIFFTPPTIINKTLKYIESYISSINSILEPSCGSGEFLSKIISKFDTSKTEITAIEYNKIVFNELKKKYTTNTDFSSINLINKSFLDYNSITKFGLIVGNPPYYVMKKADVDKKYYDFIEGRPNIFTLFIIKSMELINPDGGIIAFVLPKNFLNCLYYNKLREYIYKNYKIIAIENCESDNYLETEQDTIIFIIQSVLEFNRELIFEHNNKYSLIKGNYYIFNDINNIIKIKNLTEGSKTLSELNFKASIGSVVWNQVKDKLTNDKTKTKLIYNSNVKNGKLIDFEFKNKDKKQYINKPGLTEPILVLNRGYGKGKYSFNYCVINVDYPYLIENHLIQIKYNGKLESKDVIIKELNKLIKSFNNKKTKEFIDIFFANNAINITELNEILPIWV
jgi:adenine-specific DNA-methyltransferase